MIATSAYLKYFDHFFVSGFKHYLEGFKSLINSCFFQVRTQRTLGLWGNQGLNYCPRGLAHHSGLGPFSTASAITGITEATYGSLVGCPREGTVKGARHTSQSSGLFMDTGPMPLCPVEHGAPSIVLKVQKIQGESPVPNHSFPHVIYTYIQDNKET